MKIFNLRCMCSHNFKYLIALSVKISERADLYGNNVWGEEGLRWQTYVSKMNCLESGRWMVKMVKGNGWNKSHHHNWCFRNLLTPKSILQGRYC